jgi:membrane protein
MLENEFVERGIALAAKAFVSLFPSLLVVVAFMPRSSQQSVLNALAARMGLTGESLDLVRGAFATTSDIRRATGILGLVLTFLYINSFTGALRRVYVKAWRRPASGGARGYALGASWLLGVAVYFVLLAGARRLLSGTTGTVALGIVVWAAAIGLWWITPWVMLQRQVRLRPLLVSGVLTGTAMFVYAATARVWMAHTVESNQHQFGYFGVTLALVTFLSGAGLIVVASACAAPVLAQDQSRLGRLIRGPDDNLLAPGAASSLPPPPHASGLSAALGVRERSETESP